MTPEVVALPQDLTVEQALRTVREKGPDAETVYTLPVVDAGRRLTGVVELRELVLNEPQRLVAELVVTEPASAYATDSAEDAARLMRETNDLNLPVVDSEDRLVGLFTIDDAVEVIEAADTEDMARQSGAAPWAGHYMAASACVRAQAVGEVRGSDLLKVIWRECRVGLVLGTLLAALGLVVGTVFVDAKIALVVGITLVLIRGWAATVGGTVPLLARRPRIDPAVVSAPMVTTLVDATGLILYFLTAKAVLGV